MVIQREDAVEQNAVLVARNIATLNSMQFYLQPLDDRSKLRSFLLQEMIPQVHGTNSYMLDELFTMDKILVYIYTKEEDLEVSECQRIHMPCSRVLMLSG